MGDTFNIELVPAKLVPFDWSAIGANSIAQVTGTSNVTGGSDPNPSGASASAEDDAVAQAILTANGLPIGYSYQSTTPTGPTGLSQSGGSIYSSSHPLFPLTLTGGLVFPYTPVISETIGIKYDTTELIHANESIHAYRNSDNIRITLSDCVWTAETFDQAVYTLGVIHFFRSYRLMDFGRGTEAQTKRPGTGRPPSPMWFSAYGSFLYNAVPVLIEKVDFTFPNDVDYVGVPNPGTSAYVNQTIQVVSSSDLGGINLLASTGDFTWIPIKFQIGSISMVVQNSVAYWTKKFNLDDFKAGLMVNTR